MGFRSTMITEDFPIDIPDDFYEKYKATFSFYIDEEGKPNLPISSKFEMKTYFETYKEFIQDLAKLAQGKKECLAVVFMHECGGITKVDITEDHIYWGEPDSWKIIGVDVGSDEGVAHRYCNDCSNLKFINSK